MIIYGSLLLIHYINCWKNKSDWAEVLQPDAHLRFGPDAFTKTMSVLP